MRPIESMSSLKRESGLVAFASQAAWRILIRLYMRSYHRLRVIGGENIPDKPPFILIANHASHLDALVLAVALPWRLRRMTFPIAAGDVFFETPATIAFSAMMLNALPMWRKNCGRQALKELRSRLVEEPCNYILFPEGARSRDGALLPFKPGIGMIIADADVPIVPCRIDGAFEACPANTRLPRPRRITVRVGRAMNFKDVPNNREGWTLIAEQLKDAVIELGKKE
jgi:1-acyl-sn-glycerol-3-phosphate acyltransferase